MSEPGGSTPVRVVVAVLTYRRPVLLGRLLPHLVSQAEHLELPADVLVVDNDPGAGARDLVGAWRSRAVQYVHEPRPGIAAARNRALDSAGDARVLVFIDDDELPSEDWLRMLVQEWRKGGAAAVAGPVVASEESELGEWVVASKAFERRRAATGTTVPGAATNNLLLDLQVVRQLGLRFDERFSLTGGEDTMFTRSLVQRGGVIRWCDAAEVEAHVPADRATPRWVLRRTFRAGNSWSRMKVTLARSPAERLGVRCSLLARGLVMLVFGVARWATGRARGDIAASAEGACLAVSRAGVLAGLLGYLHVEYRRPGGAGAARLSRRRRGPRHA